MLMPSSLCLCLRPWFSWVGGFECTSSPYLSHLRYESLMHGGGAERRSYQHSHQVKGPPQRGLSSAALVPTGCQPRIILSGAPGRHLSLDDPVRGMEAPAACSAPDDPVRAIYSFFSSFARVVLRPFLLALPWMIRSWALLGLVSVSLHYLGLVRVFASLHHHGLLLLAAALLLRGLVLVPAVPLHFGVCLLFAPLLLRTI